MKLHDEPECFCEECQNKEKTSRVHIAKAFIKLLSDEERLDLFGEYCRFCGCDDPRCQCWNDR